jgi:hypothetical protein
MKTIPAFVPPSSAVPPGAEASSTPSTVGTHLTRRVGRFGVPLLILIGLAMPYSARPQQPAPRVDPTSHQPPAKFLTLKSAETESVLKQMARIIEGAGYEAVIDRQACVIDAQRALPPVGRTERREQMLVWFYRDAVNPELYLHIFASIGRFNNPMGAGQMKRYIVPTNEQHEIEKILSSIRKETQKLYE